MVMEATASICSHSISLTGIYHSSAGRSIGRKQNHVIVKSMATQKPLQSVSTTVGSRKSTPIKLLTRLEKLKLLSKAEKAGLLSAAEKAGLSLSTIEKLGLLSKAEEFGVLSAATNPGTPGTLLTLSFTLLLLGPLFVYLVPEDNIGEVGLQVAVAIISVLGGSAGFAASNLVSNLQKSI
ncbi:unnamed protein product [Lupinus luteus]|uniref:Wiskott-aldrich syndrome family protein n=1 Tax=Lupinus luteus TaxID=3873 RepID=A0AAV1WDC7_LUPLU